MKLLIIGHARHGKDSVGAILQERAGLRVCPSSEFAAQKAIYPLVDDLYPDWQTAYADRRNHREMWYHAIRAYNLRPGPSLAERILVEHDAYIGMRSREELTNSNHLFDLIIWVDASKRLPPEPFGSNELFAADADMVIYNNDTLADLPTMMVEVISAVREHSGR